LKCFPYPSNVSHFGRAISLARHGNGRRLTTNDQFLKG
jgi:hypothetical protein